MKNGELHELSNDISNLLNSTRIPVVMLDRRLYIRRITPSASGLFAVRPADVGRPFTDIKLNIDMASHALEAEIGKVLDSLQAVEREVQDLEGRWHALSILPYRTQDNKIDGVVLALQDIDAIKSARDQLARSNDFFRGISDTVREPLLVLDADLRVISANESFLNTFRVSAEQTWNRLLYDLGNGQWQIPALRKLLERVLPEKQTVTDFEVEHNFEMIGMRTMLLNAKALVQPNQRQPMILLAIEDISDRKLTEAALIKSEKLATAGRLAATLAHEINNPLQAISNLVDLWVRSPGLDEQLRTCATMAENELRRVTHLTQQSLSFYRESASPIMVSLEETIDSVLSIYDTRIEAKKIQVTKRFRLNGTMIRTFPGEIRQVLSTLLLNAVEAVHAGGAIAVRTRNVTHAKNRSIRGIRVTVFDNGVGIPAYNLARVFEPFFTTKGENGTGLGLWVASGIVDRAGGSILTRSRVGPGAHGTCFSIFLPVRH